MRKPIIAIFVAGNLATKSEQEIIDKYMKYPCVILNAETYTKQESLVVDAVIGEVPSYFENLPHPDQVIKDYEAYLGTLGNDVGGNPPKAEEVKQEDLPKAEEQPANAFGTPPVKPNNK